MPKQLLVFFLVLPAFLFSQETERKGRFFFNIGPEYRITPIYGTRAYSNQIMYTDPDAQNSGMALHIGFDYYITENWSIGFQNSFRYDLVTAQIDSFGPSGPGTALETRKDLLIGYHFALGYRFQIFGKGDLLLNAGFSLLNRNSEFTIKESIYDNNGQQIGTITSLADSKFGANSFALGYGKGRSKVMLGIYFTRSSGYFENNASFMIPFLTYHYRLGRL
tara:strand:- start:20171 stop:20833 length:663 start_codon:yes stop_codon:yes gene_type:complete